MASSGRLGEERQMMLSPARATSATAAIDVPVISTAPQIGVRYVSAGAS